MSEYTTNYNHVEKVFPNQGVQNWQMNAKEVESYFSIKQYLFFFQWSMKPKTAFLNLAQPEWVISSTRLLHEWEIFLATMSTIQSRSHDWMRPDNGSRQHMESRDRKEKKSYFCKWNWIQFSMSIYYKSLSYTWYFLLWKWTYTQYDNAKNINTCNYL